MTSESYPKAPILSIELALWNDDKATDFIRERIKLHNLGYFSAAMDEELPECNADDRWQREATYAVMKEGRKTAVKLFDNQQAADEFAVTKEKHYVQARPSEPVRCTGNYCGVNKWCSQYRQEDTGSDAGSELRPEEG